MMRMTFSYIVSEPNQLVRSSSVLMEVVATIISINYRLIIWGLSGELFSSPAVRWRMETRCGDDDG
eukprot:scaffold7359_cov36-Cyclotella_meneghiniana.AAC.1